MLAVQEFWGKEKNFTMEKKQNHFSGQLGFVLAAAGSAVGVGNLWRFPYLAAKDGGGLFLIIYFILVLTFGFTLLTSDIAIGRRTHKSAIGAYEQMRPKWKGLGILTFLVPVLIMTYYAVIGGWITKYAVVYVSGQASAAAADDYFTSFITSPVSPVVFALLFMGVTALIVYNGVQNGIEKVSRWMMPVLLVLVVVIACYSLTLSHTNADGQVVTGWQGFLYYLTPNLEGLTVQRFLQILLDAMSQLFFSLSVSMGIMITYGSYLSPKADLPGAVGWVAVLAIMSSILGGLMVLPAVFAFGLDPSAGPGLTFVTMPAVFSKMPLGQLFAVMFYVCLVVAALTSSVSMLEACTALLTRQFNMRRTPAILLTVASCTVVGLASTLSFGVWSDVKFFNRTIFDILDYVTSNVGMPLSTFGIAIAAAWVAWPTMKRELTAARPVSESGLWFIRIMIGVVSPLFVLVVAGGSL